MPRPCIYLPCSSLSFFEIVFAWGAKLMCKLAETQRGAALPHGGLQPRTQQLVLYTPKSVGAGMDTG